jgi:hypothetical protein
VSVEEIKRGITALSLSEQNELSAFLFHLRHAADAEYQERLDVRLADQDRANWLTPEEFERRLDRE